MIATGKGAVIYPVVVVKVDGVKCRALLESGAGSSCISGADKSSWKATYSKGV